LIGNLRSRFPNDGSLGVRLGIALNPSTDNQKIAQCASLVDFIQCMGSDKLGHHGVSLDERLYEKLAVLRKEYPTHIISVDIGVDLETAPQLVSAGANKLISGSAIFESKNIAETIELLKKALQG